MNKVILIILFNLFFISSYGITPGHVPTNGLQAWYEFDGNANNSFSASFHGTVTGPVNTTDRFGNPNGAYQFDGVDDFIDLEPVYFMMQHMPQYHAGLRHLDFLPCKIFGKKGGKVTYIEYVFYVPITKR